MDENAEYREQTELSWAQSSYFTTNGTWLHSNNGEPLDQISVPRTEAVKCFSTSQNPHSSIDRQRTTR